MEDHLHHAFALAAQARGECCPNPAVGAVVVKDGRRVGEGYHRGPGQPHAEVEALRMAGEAARGATVVVTLEPCCHWGRTPPCTDALLRAGVTRVVYGYEDPNPVVRGKGAGLLREAGIAVESLTTAEAASFYRGYTHWTLTGEPRLVAKLAVSADGKVAGPGGRPMKISGEQADRFTHRQRREADAILTTAATVWNDDPRLNAREEGKEVARPVWVLVRQGKFPSQARLWKTARRLHLVLPDGVEEDPEWALRGAVVHRIGRDGEGLDLKALRRRMGEQGYHQVWVEAGPRLFEALGSQGLLDQAMIYHCPVVVGSDGVPAFHSDRWLGRAQVTWRALGRDGWMDLEYPCSRE